MKKTSNNQSLTALFLSVTVALLSLVAFYYLSAENTLTRVAVLLVGLGAAFFIFLRSEQGAKFQHFLKETRIELIKVVWPNRSETIKTTVITLIAVVIIGLILWMIDGLFFYLVQLLMA